MSKQQTAAERNAELQGSLNEVLQRLGEANARADGLRTRVTALERQLAETGKELEELRRANVAMREKVARQAGYIDRVLEQEPQDEPHRAADGPVELRSRGPALAEYDTQPGSVFDSLHNWRK